MQLALFQGYPDYIGKRLALCGSGSGPASYATGGDPIAYARFGNYIDSLNPAISVSGTYLIYPIPSAASVRATWKAKWIVASTGLEVAAATNLSGESVILSGYGGVY